MTAERRAHEKAEKLLLSYLSPHQRHTLRIAGFFYVRGQDGLFALWNGMQIVGLDYKGRPQWIYGITSYDEYLYSYSSHSPIPLSDKLLAQMLLLQTDVRKMRKIACRVSAVGYYNNLPKVIRTGDYFEARPGPLRRLYNHLFNPKLELRI